MLGIIIGVIALVVLVSLVNSATTSVTDQISSLGNNLLSATILIARSNPLRLSDLYAAGRSATELVALWSALCYGKEWKRKARRRQSTETSVLGIAIYSKFRG